MFLTGVWHLDRDYDMATGLWYTNVLNFGSILILKVQRTSMSLKSWMLQGPDWSSACSLSPHLGLWRTLKIPDWGLTSWSWPEYGHWSLRHPWSEFWLSILLLKVQRTSMSFKSSFGALEDAGGSWLGFGILIIIWIWSLVFSTPIFWILALYLDFGCAKNIHFL